MNLIGGPALAPREFAARPQRATLGASITVVAPSGQYDPVRLVNIGSNRWSVKPELGYSKPRGPWRFEGTFGVWLYSSNEAYLGKKEFSQQPIGTFQGHLSYTFRPQLWVAGSATYFVGGRTSTNGVPSKAEQANSRIGVEASIPIGAGQQVKVTYARGLTTRLGGNLTAIGVAWQYAWY
jgi:hypothetical protein